jgi:AP endonuclease-2
VLLGVYSPANRDESRVEFRLGFLHALDVRIRNLVSEGKQVILTGDLNISRSDMDSTNVAETLRKEGISVEDWISSPARRLFNHLVFEGTVIGQRDEGREKPVLWDLCRCFHPTREGMNTCWDTKRNTRPANNGSRIDYVLCTDGIKDWVTSSDIQEGLMGSDHCPVFATLADKVAKTNEEHVLSELMNPPGMFKDQRRLREWGQKDLLPLSARLIPEFDRRQSIRDMFTKKVNPVTQGPSSTDASTKPPNGKPTDSFSSHQAPAKSGSERSESQNGALDEPSQDRTIPSSISKPAFQPIPRRLADTPDNAPSRSFKRSKSSSNSGEAKNKAAPGQRTLQGFFKPKTPTSQSEKPSTESTSNLIPSPTKSSFRSSDSKPSQRQPPSRSPSDVSEEHPPKKAKIETSEKVFDPIEAKESWSKLLSKRVAPRCEHNEPCISLTTKKPGVNCGKSSHISIIFMTSVLLIVTPPRRNGVVAVQRKHPRTLLSRNIAICNSMDNG